MPSGPAGVLPQQVLRFDPEGTAELSATEEHLLAALRRCAGEIEQELRH
ncbi:hypothetical protein [Streptomyces sp. NPDC048590]